MNYSFHLWQILAAIGALAALDWLSTWFAGQYEVTWGRPFPRADRRWYGRNAHVVLRGNEDDADAPRYAVLDWDAENLDAPSLKVHQLDPDSNYWDDNAEAFWAPVTSFAPYAVRRLRPWIFRYRWLRIPVLFSYQPVRHVAGRLEADV